ncbi:MAG: hypothetical protein AB7G28_22780 [Pirellulales bacterium]
MPGRFSIDSVQIHDVAMSSAVTFRCVGEVSVDNGMDILTPDSGGSYDEVAFVGAAKVEGAFACKALESLTDNVPIAAVKCITADGSHPGVRIFGQLHDPCGTAGRASGSVHLRITLAKCWLAIQRIAGTVGQSAVATVRIIGGSTDGSADPDDQAYNAALPTTFIANEEFVIAEPTLATGLVFLPDYISGWTYDSGLRITTKMGAGSIYNTGIDVEKIQPTLAINHEDPTIIDPAKVPKRGRQVLITQTKFPLIKRSPFGGLISRASAEHLLMKCEGYCWAPRHFAGGGPTPVTGDLNIRCTEPSGGGAPVTITKDQVIT